MAITITFQGTPVYNDCGETLIVCWGLDCELGTYWLRDTVTILTGTSRWWSVGGRAAYTWDGYPLVVPADNIGIVHRNDGLVKPVWVFGPPPPGPQPPDATMLGAFAAEIHDKVYPELDGPALDDASLPPGLKNAWANLAKTPD